MKLFTIAQHTTGEGKDSKIEYQIAGNVSLVDAMHMMTEALVVAAQNEGRIKSEQEVTP